MSEPQLWWTVLDEIGLIHPQRVRLLHQLFEVSEGRETGLLIQLIPLRKGEDVR